MKYRIFIDDNPAGQPIGCPSHRPHGTVPAATVMLPSTVAMLF